MRPKAAAVPNLSTAPADGNKTYPMRRRGPPVVPVWTPGTRVFGRTERGPVAGARSSPVNPCQRDVRIHNRVICSDSPLFAGTSRPFYAC